MKLHKIKRVEEIRKTASVNKMLSDGWVLLDIYKVDTYGGPYPCEEIFYVLGNENPDAEVLPCQSSDSDAWES